MAIKIETVQTDTFSMDFFRFGKGERTLVILPGLSVQSVMGLADAVASAYQNMAETFTIYLFDRRRDLPPVYSVRDMARDTAAAFKALGLRDVCLFGASQGGMIAMVLAIEYPELVGKMVLGSTSSHVKAPQFRVIEGWIDLAKRGDKEGLYLDFGREVYPPAVFEASREALIAAAATVTDADLERFIILTNCPKSSARSWRSACSRIRYWIRTRPWRLRRNWISGRTSGSTCTRGSDMRLLIRRRIIGRGWCGFSRSE